MNLEQFIEKHQKVPVEEYPNHVLEEIPNPIVSCRVSTYQHAPIIFTMNSFNIKYDL